MITTKMTLYAGIAVVVLALIWGGVILSSPKLADLPELELSESSGQDAGTEANFKTAKLSLPSYSDIPKEKSNKAEVKIENEKEIEPLNVVLHGILMGGDSGSSIAMIKDGNTNQVRSYYEGEIIQGRKIISIKQDVVVLEIDGEKEYVYLDDSPVEYNDYNQEEEVVEKGTIPKNIPKKVAKENKKEGEKWINAANNIHKSFPQYNKQKAELIKQGITPVSETEINIDKEKVLGAVQDNPFQVAQEISALPAIDSGEIVGVKIEHVEPGGAVEAGGILPGDIIISANGKELNNPVEYLNLPTELMQADKVDVVILRDGQLMTMTYNLD